MSDHRDMHEDDERLRRLFARMRQEDREVVPPFPTIETRPERSWRWLPAAAAAAAAALLVLVWIPGSDPAPEDGVLLAEWSAPTTAFLGLDDLGVDFAVGIDGDAEPYDEWMDLPTDSLIEQADEMFGQENRQ